MKEQVNEALRGLIDQYEDRYLRLQKEEKECIDNKEKEINEALQRQCRIMTAELFQTMKNLGLLDEEEMAIGNVKSREYVNNQTHVNHTHIHNTYVVSQEQPSIDDIIKQINRRFEMEKKLR